MIKTASMSSAHSFRAFWWYLALAMAAVILAPLHAALAWVGYPIALVAAIVAGLSMWEYYQLHVGAIRPPPSGGMGTGIIVTMLILVWVALAAVELVTLAIVWLAGGLS